MSGGARATSYMLTGMFGMRGAGAGLTSRRRRHADPTTFRYTGCLAGSVGWRVKWSVGAALAVVSWLGSGAAHAAAIRLDAKACPELDEKGLARLISVEFEPAPDASSPPFSAILSCQRQLATLVVAHRESRLVRIREVDLHAYARDARMRLVILTMSELVSELDEELRGDAEAPAIDSEPRSPARRPSSGSLADREGATVPELARPSSASSDNVADKDPPPESAADIDGAFAVASARFITQTEGGLLGGGARVTGVFSGLFRWTTDLLVERGTISQGAGSFAVDAVTAGAVVGLNGQWKRVSLSGGVGVRAGLTDVRNLDGVRSRSAATLAPWGWPMLMGSIIVEPGRSWLVGLSGETGYTLLPVTPGGSQVTNPSLRGWWLSAQLALGFRP